MVGRPSWQLRHILLLMLLLRANWPVEEIMSLFTQVFPLASIGHSRPSIEYCRKEHLRRPGIYNQDMYWTESNPPQGKLPYLMGLYAKGGSSFTGIARLIRERFPSDAWPQGFSDEEAVEIAARTNGEYAEYAGRTSLIARHPSRNAAIPYWVIACYSPPNCFSPEYIQACQEMACQGMLQAFDRNGNLLRPLVLIDPIGFDDIIFILTRFVPGFAESYRTVLPGSIPISMGFGM